MSWVNSGAPFLTNLIGIYGIDEGPHHLISAMQHEPPEPDIHFDIQTPNVALWTDGSLVGGRHMSIILEK